MPLIKITNVGDGNGALSVERNSTVPTYGERIETRHGPYEVTDVCRFVTNKRLDAVRVDVTPIEDEQKVVV